MEEFWLIWFREGVKSFGIEIDEEKIKKFKIYLTLIKEWNKKFNITGEKTDEAIAIKQFLDSIVPIFYDKSLIIKNGIDIGTGAGIPGIPIKIFLPDSKITLVDSMKKRVEFLKYVKSSLSLDDVIIINERAEKLLRSKHFREKFDSVFLRWVLKIPGIFELSLPFSSIGGRVFLWKGVDEIDLIRKNESFIEELGGRIEDTFIYKLPYFESERVLLIIRKVRETPNKFPRSWKRIKSLSFQQGKPQRG